MRSSAQQRGTPAAVIAVEGPNGAGKSSVAAHIAEHTGGTVVRYPESFMLLRQTARIDDQEPLPRLLSYLAGITLLDDTLRRGRGSLVCDRYFASPLAMLLAEGAMRSEDLTAVAQPVLRRITIPALTVLLTADHSTLVARLRQRTGSRPSASYRQTHGSAEFVVAWTNALRHLTTTYGPVIEVDTSAHDLAEVCAIVDRALPTAQVDR